MVLRQLPQYKQQSTFLCLPKGKILTDDFADKEGLEMGDEYFANLDHIESVENFKEGYESEAHCSDSEGSGVDVSKIKIQPSALVSSNPVGRPPRKGESQSKGEKQRLFLMISNKSKNQYFSRYYSFKSLR